MKDLKLYIWKGHFENLNKREAKVTTIGKFILASVILFFLFMLDKVKNRYRRLQQNQSVDRDVKTLLRPGIHGPEPIGLRPGGPPDTDHRKNRNSRTKRGSLIETQL